MNDEAPPFDGKIRFLTARQLEILVITADGRLERGKDFRTDDEASVAFIDCLNSVLPVIGGYPRLNVGISPGVGDLRGFSGGDVNLISGTAAKDQPAAAGPRER